MHDASIIEQPPGQRDAHHLDDVAAQRGDDNRRPHQAGTWSGRPAGSGGTSGVGRTPATTATAAAKSTGTPVGTNGTETSATPAARSATARGSRRRNRGDSNARKAAGAAASRPNVRGSRNACAASPPISVAAFQNTKTDTPVAQKANRAAGLDSRTIAIAMLSSMTSWAAIGRQRARNRKRPARRMP